MPPNPRSAPDPRPGSDSASEDDRAALPHGERVAAVLRDEILRQRFRAGERLPSERDLALRFGVHRGAVREALKKLEQLGVAEVRPGGARVLPLDQASLDVVVHLLSLDERPDPEIVDQVLEVLSGLFAMAARLGVTRANSAQRSRAASILTRLEDSRLDPDARHVHLQQLGDVFVEASGNLVLQLVRRGLQTEAVLDRLLRLREHASDCAEPPPFDRSLLRRIRDAVAERDGEAASEAVQELTLALRRFARETLGAPLDEKRSEAPRSLR
jgi:DNA-binding FadR family transcriptional regulator